MLSKYRNKDWIAKYKFQFILSLCLVISPFLIYFHLLFDPNQKSLLFFGFNLESEIITLQALSWILISDLSALIVLCILFFSISAYWKYVLLIPIFIYMENFVKYFDELIGVVFKYPYLKMIIPLILLLIVFALDHLAFRKFRRRVVNLKLLSIIINKSKKDIGQIDKGTSGIIENNKISSDSMLYELYFNKLSYEKFFKSKKWYSVSDLICSNTKESKYFTLLVLSSIGIWFSHYLVPEGTMSYDLGFFTVSAHGYNDVRIFIWVISRKIMLIVPIAIWFISYHSWWRYAALSPLSLYLFQFWEAFQDNYASTDAYGNYKVFPFVLASVILLLALSRVVRRYSQSLDTYEEISWQIESQINKLGQERSGISDYRKRFEKIRNKLINDGVDDINELTHLQRELQRKTVS